MTTLRLDRKRECSERTADDVPCGCGCCPYEDEARCGRPDCPHGCYDIFWGNPCVYIMVGLPGSGKSTVAREMAALTESHGHSAVIHSTDDYFMVDGKYVFDRDKLAYNHKQNQEAFKQSVRDKVHTIIVDNTNLVSRDRRVYANYAKGGKYRVVYVVVGGFDEAAVLKCHASTVHNVPLETINRMAKRARIPGA